MDKPTVVLGDGNAFAILGRCNRAMRGAGWTQEEQDKFRKEAMSGDYDHLIATVMRNFNVELER